MEEIGHIKDLTNFKNKSSLLKTTSVTMEKQCPDSNT